MQLEYAKDPRWANAEQTLINLTVRFAEIPEDLPFTASPEDCEAHGRAIFAAAGAGQFGSIADYVAPTPVELTYAEKRAREYPPITDYIDGVVKGDQDQIDAYIDACLAVKAKYPKP